MGEVPELFRIDEVAVKLRKSKRWLQDFLRLHPCGRRAGRTLLFTVDDVIYLINELPREGERAPMSVHTFSRGKDQNTVAVLREMLGDKSKRLKRTPLSKPR